jgi:serine phosphatase RsbU (regulator of sigma subunit)
MWDTLLSGESWHGEVCNRCKNGELYWVRASVKPILDDIGLPVQYVSIRTDITEIKQFDAKLQRTNAELEIYRNISEYEMNIARKLMDHMIQKSLAQVKDVELWLQAATNMSGDLVITQNYKDERSYILLADAMGHGLPAALPLMPIVQVFSAMAWDGFTISAMVREMNAKIHDLVPTGNFVAVTLLGIDHGNKFVEIWNGGNPPALLTNEAGEITRKFTSHHLALGILTDDVFDSSTELFHLDQDGWLTLYSDGLAEAQNVQGLEFGEERIIDALRGSKEPHQSLRNAVLAHLGGRDASDDISIATVSLHG